MNDLFFARSQMGMSLAFHIVFAVIGMAMPLLMVVSEGCYLRTKKPIFLELGKRWAAGTTILFAVGAVSGTVLSFELGLLWPKFMQYGGGIIGMPVSLEGFAFFTEAIFLGIYLAAVAQVTFILLGWGLAQFPHLVTADVTLQNAAAPESTLKLLLLALGAGAVVLLASLIYLFQIFEGQEER